MFSNTFYVLHPKHHTHNTIYFSSETFVFHLQVVAVNTSWFELVKSSSLFVSFCVWCLNAHLSFIPVCAGAGLASADWGTWILHIECLNSGWTPGCTVSGTLWQPRPNDPARDCTVHREVLYSRTAPHPHPSSPLELSLHAVFFSQPLLICLHFPILSHCCQQGKNCLLAYWRDGPPRRP